MPSYAQALRQILWLAVFLAALLGIVASGCTPSGFARAKPYAEAAEILSPYTLSGISADSTLSSTESDALMLLEEQLREGLGEAASREEAP